MAFLECSKFTQVTKGKLRICFVKKIFGLGDFWELCALPVLEIIILFSNIFFRCY